MRFQFCPHCATPLIQTERGGRLRPVCPACGLIHYRNPTVGVAVIVQDDHGRILLGRRSPDSSYPGHWCIPCGHVEWDEKVRAAAIREFAEETGLTVALGTWWPWSIPTSTTPVNTPWASGSSASPSPAHSTPGTIWIVSPFLPWMLCPNLWLFPRIGGHGGSSFVG